MSALWGRCRGVSAMADKRRLNLSFSLTSPQQREAWRILSSIPVGQRTDTVCRMVCKAHEQDALLSAIRGLIREELRHLNLTTEKASRHRPGTWMRMSSAFFLPCSRKEMRSPDTLF